MLPRKLYELLPYLYICTGVMCAFLIDSTIVLISSMLLIVAGIFVLLMRRNFRKSINRNFQLHQAAYDPAFNEAERRSGVERRKIYDLDYFAKGGVERRRSTKRRGQEQRRNTKMQDSICGRVTKKK